MRYPYLGLQLTTIVHPQFAICNIGRHLGDVLGAVCDKNTEFMNLAYGRTKHSYGKEWTARGQAIQQCLEIYGKWMECSRTKHEEFSKWMEGGEGAHGHDIHDTLTNMTDTTDGRYSLRSSRRMPETVPNAKW